MGTAEYLTRGYLFGEPNHKEEPNREELDHMNRTDTKRDINEAASALGKRSAEVRQKKWGKREFLKRMREYAKLGGRPKKMDKDRRA